MKGRVPRGTRTEGGDLGCLGCAGVLSLRLALEALGSDTVAVVPACCWSAADGPLPHQARQVTVFHTPHAAAAVVAAGVKAAKELQGKETTVMAWSGDGGALEDGLHVLGGAAERNDDLILCCYDTETFGNVGLRGPDSPGEKPAMRPRASLLEMLAAFRLPYAATCSAAFPEDMKGKIEKARGITGTRFLHILSACPPGWEVGHEDALAAMRLAVESRAFPLYEVEGGRDTTISYWPEEETEIEPEEYFGTQGRFRTLLEDADRLAEVKRNIDRQWETLVRRHNRTHEIGPDFDYASRSH